MSAVLETDVLVIGSGPAGSGAALALATLGVDHMVITKYRWTANTPRSHITNQRTVEIFRDLGIDADVLAQGTEHDLMGETVFCSSLAGDELGRVRTWETAPERASDYLTASPSPNCDIPQTLLEPILVGHAASRGSRIRFDTEYVGLEQDADGVTVTVRDRTTGHEYAIRAKYVLGADGGRSQIAEDVGLPFEGEMDVAGSMNIVFHADLSHLVAHRPSVLYWVLQPGATHPYAGVPAVFAPEVATFHFYTGGIPIPPTDWNGGATRGWFAHALWTALDSYWGVDRVP